MKRCDKRSFECRYKGPYSNQWGYSRSVWGAVQRARQIRLAMESRGDTGDVIVEDTVNAKRYRVELGGVFDAETGAELRP